MKPCDHYCPFASCDACIWSDGSVPQQDSADGQGAETPDLAYNGSEHGTAPAEVLTHLDRGLTLTRLPTRPGGISG